MDTSPELVNPTGKFKIGSEEAELALNYAGAGRGRTRHHLTCYTSLQTTGIYRRQTDKHNGTNLSPHPSHHSLVLVSKIFFAYFSILFKYSTLLGQPSSSSSSSCLFYRITLTNIYNQWRGWAGSQSERYKISPAKFGILKSWHSS